jgi:type II secretory pathway component PulK
MSKRPFSLLRNQNGVAIIMVMTAVTILTFLMAEFTFDVKLNKIKTYNYQDKLKARLTAESGLHFAMAKLRIYQEGRNLIEKNENLKKIVNPSDLEAPVVMPFVFPIPIPKNSNVITRNALQEFSKNTVLEGELTVSVQPVKGFLNPNNMRIKIKKDKDKEKDTRADEDDDDDEDTSKTDPHLYIEKKLVETLTRAIQQKSEEDDDFNSLYANVNPELLIKELKFYVSDPKNFNDAERAEIEGMYLAKDIAPKHAPLTSLDELYLLEGWDDAIVDLIKDQLTVHEVAVISLNELTKDQLELIFPDITPVQTEEFFKHRDGDPDKKIEPKEFKSADDFKQLIVNKLAVVDDTSYTKRVKEFEDAGLKLDVAGKLFKITSSAKYERAVYTLTAFVDMPIKPEPPKEDTKKKTDDSSTDVDETVTETDKETTTDTDSDPEDDDKDKDKEKEKKKIELLAPRIVEIRID